MTCETNHINLKQQNPNNMWLINIFIKKKLSHALHLTTIYWVLCINNGNAI